LREIRETETLGESLEKDIQFYKSKIEEHGNPEDHHVLELLHHALECYSSIHSRKKKDSLWKLN
jgi:hypothetical protein